MSSPQLARVVSLGTLALLCAMAPLRATDSTPATVGERPLVIVITGESNAGGVAKNADATAEERGARPAVQILHPDRDKLRFEDLQLGINNLREHKDLESHYATSHGLENGLAGAVERGAFPGRSRVWLIKTGHGGSKIAQWSPAHPSGYWATFLQRIEAAKRQLAPEPQWVVWMSLGINDASTGTPADAWRDDVIQHIERMRRELPGAIVILTQFQSMKRFPEFDRVIAEIAEILPGVRAVDTTGATLADGVHWGYAGAKTVAERMVEATIAELQTRAGEPPPHHEPLGLVPVLLGRVGCRVFGTVEKKRFQFNEDSLWVGDEAGGAAIAASRTNYDGNRGDPDAKGMQGSGTGSTALPICPLLDGQLLAVTAPVSRQVFQRDAADQAVVTIRGTVSRPIDSIELKAELAPGATRGQGTDWIRIAGDEAIAAGGFSGTVRLPAGGWYAITIRAKHAGQVVAEAGVDRVGVGEVFVTAGQSNSANFGAVRQKAKDDRVVYFNGSSYVPAQDPIPGGCGDGGSPWPILGDRIAESQGVPVCFRSASLQWTEVKNWLPPSTLLYKNLAQCVKPFGTNGVRAVLWHQGESDTLVKTSAAPYADRLKTIMNALSKDAGYSLPWFVAEASFHPGSKAPEQQEVAQGQWMLWEKKIAHQGPSTDDLLGTKYRYDGVHFNQAGLTAHAERWFDALKAHYGWKAAAAATPAAATPASPR